MSRLVGIIAKLRHFVPRNTLPRIYQSLLLYSWRFPRYRAPIYWLVHGHMTANNETVSRQMPWAGNIAKTMTSKGKQFTVTREILTAVACDQKWPDVVTGISARFSKFGFVLFCYITNHLITGRLGNSELSLHRISMFPSGPVIKCKILPLLFNKL